MLLGPPIKFEIGCWWLTIITAISLQVFTAVKSFIGYVVERNLRKNKFCVLIRTCHANCSYRTRFFKAMHLLFIFIAMLIRRKFVTPWKLSTIIESYNTGSCHNTNYVFQQSSLCDIYYKTFYSCKYSDQVNKWVVIFSYKHPSNAVKSMTLAKD